MGSALRGALEPGPHLASCDPGPAVHHLTQEFIWQGTQGHSPHLRAWANSRPDHQAAGGSLGTQPDRSVNLLQHWFSGPAPNTNWQLGHV